MRRILSPRCAGTTTSDGPVVNPVLLEPATGAREGTPVLAAVWAAVLSRLEHDSTISRASFATWLRQTELLACEGGVYVIGAPHRFARDRLERAFREPVQRAIAACTGRPPVEVRFVIVEHSGLPVASDSHLYPKEEGASPPSRAPNAYLQMSHGGGIGTSAGGVERPRPSGAARMVLPPEPAPGRAWLLDPRLRFETFIVSERNRFALAAARAVAANPGGTYNPLVIYGEPGAGKTHLLHAIGHALLGAWPAARIVLLPAASLVAEGSHRAHAGRDALWRRLAQQADALLLDDVHLLAAGDGPTATALGQRALIQLLDALYTRGRQIVVTSNRPPRELTHFQEQVRSRLQLGLVADIAAPEAPRVRQRGLLVPAALAARAWSPALPAQAVPRLPVASSLERPVDGRLRVLAEARQPERQAASLERSSSGRWQACRAAPAVEVLAAVARRYGVPESALRGAQRHASVVRPRQVAMYLLREACGLSLSEIGALLGGRDHTTVLHGCRQIQRRLAVDAVLAGEIEAIRRDLARAADDAGSLPLRRAAAAD